ncbi:hypothetical protein Misp01_04300 [Microtetraspora sp. NBRC 13810]|uniref:hypothetical protein n=1 Tax=Microtetraspora sp. NBRC 13810 TaxID=3030990 RepID=UPI0024A1B30D|nr:hypothetical protein [Microtetraspora sp. NBRC 13810]GLW05300.1 hypothetical protein Misp01_04300 [Microtetraspora sp. NBRC 13810]
MRGIWRRRTLLPAVILTISLAACSGGGTPEPAPVAATKGAQGAPAAPAAPRLTRDDAQEALDRYLATDDVLRAGGDLRMALEQVRDGQSAITSAAYRSTVLQPPRYRWRPTGLIVPRLDAPPYWFTAVVEREARSATLGATATRTSTRTAGAPDPAAARSAVLTLMKQDDDARWQLSFASLLYPGDKLPEPALDADGYATALSSRDESIEITPQLMAPLHATVAEEGAKGFSAALIAPDTHTTGYSTEITEKRDQAKDVGLGYDSIFSATQSPIFAWRTRGGGGVVCYPLTRTTTYSARLPSAPWIVVPPDARWAIGDPAVAKELRIVETQQYVSVVPPRATHGAARVIAYDGAVTRVTGR